MSHYESRMIFLTYAKFSFTDRTVKSINEKALRSFRSSDFWRREKNGKFRIGANILRFYSI